MFVITLTYIKPLKLVDRYLKEHRDHLEKGYQQNYLIASGPKTPRVGGILLSQLTDRKIVEEFILNDPFSIHAIASFEIVEFTPVKYHPDFAKFV